MRMEGGREVGQGPEREKETKKKKIRESTKD